MQKTKLLLADVDGTLVTSEKKLTKRAIDAVDRLRQNGILFAITSGRPPRGMQMLFEPLGIDTPIAGFNGGLWVNPDLSQISAHLLPADVAQRAAALLAESRLDVWVYSGADWLLHRGDAPHVAREQWTVKFAPTMVESFATGLEAAVKIVGVSDDLDLVARCEEKLQTALGQTVSAARSQPYYLDITHPAANKGDVVQFLANHFGIKTSLIATIGDQVNDVQMFRRGGVSIAMGNASQAVQAQADHVTASCEEEGFARAVEDFILGAEYG